MSTGFLCLDLCKHLSDSNHSIPSWTHLSSMLTKSSSVTTKLLSGLALKKMLSGQCLEPYILAISFTLPTSDPITTESSASFQPLMPYTISRCSCTRCTCHLTSMPPLTMAVSYHLPAGMRALLLLVCALLSFHRGCPINFSFSQFKQDTCPIKQLQVQHEVVQCFKGCTSSGFVVSEKLPPLPWLQPRW